MSFPAYFPPSKSKLKSLPSTTKEIVFDTSNWPSERTKMANQSKDPHSPDFNWFFWCGLPNKEDITSFIEKYNNHRFSCFLFEQFNLWMSQIVHKITL